MMRIDLHLHTNRSDGVMSPELLAHECLQSRVSIMSVTDHDTMAGSDELCAQDPGLTCLPGVELSMADMPGLHVLGYGLCPGKKLREKLTQLANKREERARAMLSRLESMGMPVSYQQLAAKRCLEGGPGATIGRPHIARALVRAGYCRNMQEAFALYIGNGKPAYVPSERMAVAEAIPLLLDAGFLPVLAHPRELHLEEQLLQSLLDRLCGMGLRGLEVYHPSARSTGFAGLLKMASDRKLLVTGGSDFHQENDGKHGRIGCMADVWIRPDEDMARFMEALQTARDKHDAK